MDRREREAQAAGEGMGRAGADRRDRRARARHVQLAQHIGAARQLGQADRALAISGDPRLPLLPQVPTFIEAGLTAYNEMGWQGMFAPAATPRPIVGRALGGARQNPCRTRPEGAVREAGSRAVHFDARKVRGMLEAESGEARQARQYCKAQVPGGLDAAMLSNTAALVGASEFKVVYEDNIAQACDRRKKT